jgi:Sec-independent protein translocase protein TatA
MKLQRFVVAALTLVFAVALVNCGEKSEKERLMDAMKEFGEYMGEFQKEAEALQESGDMEKMASMMEEMQAKMDEIAKNNGFESFEAMGPIAEKYEDDPDVKKLIEELEEKYDL